MSGYEMPPEVGNSPHYLNSLQRHVHTAGQIPPHNRRTFKSSEALNGKTYLHQDRARDSKRLRISEIERSLLGTRAVDTACPLCETTGAPFFQYGPETRRAFYRCDVCNLVFVLPSVYVSVDAEADRYRLHNNDCKDPRYHAFLERAIAPLVCVLDGTSESEPLSEAPLLFDCQHSSIQKADDVAVLSATDSPRGTEQQSSEDPSLALYMKETRRSPLTWPLGPRVGLDFGSGPGPTVGIMLQRRGYVTVNYDPHFCPSPNMHAAFEKANLKGPTDVTGYDLAYSAEAETVQSGAESVQCVDERKRISAQTDEQTGGAPSVLPFALQLKYRFVTCTEVLEHIKRPREILSLLFNLVAPGGVLVIMTGVLQENSHFKGWHYHRDVTHICFYCEESLRYIERMFPWRMFRPHKDVAMFFKGTS